MRGRSSAAAVTQDFALAQGLRDTRGALEQWRREPGDVLGPWFAGALAIAVALLAGVWAISLLLTPDATEVMLTGIGLQVSLAEFSSILGNNLLVLALHATACVAGFIAGSSLPLAAREMSGFKRWVHEKAGPMAIGWVVLVTTFSLLTQALGLGFDAATLADQLGIGSWQLILTVLPHALLELTAVFLPLAAWLIASRREQWHDLLAATFVTVGLALPMLLAATLIELYLWPRLLIEASPLLS